jgi:hypothetical protein
MAIEACADLRGFFQGMVIEAMRRRRVDAEAETTEYVTDLLVACAGTDGAALLDRPLVWMLDAAMAGADGARLHGLCAAGDAALARSGLFAAPEDVEYFTEVGKFAYRGAAAEAQRAGGEAPVALAELGERFPDFVEVLAEASALGDVTKALVRRYAAQTAGQPKRCLSSSMYVSTASRDGRS